MTDRTGTHLSLAQTIRGGATTVGTFISLGSAAATEVCALAGFDWLLVDLEHGSGTETALLGQITAAAVHDIPVIVRTESFERIRAGRALDMGAAGIMLPRIDTPEQASDAIADLKYPPHGRRGVANYNRSRQFTLDTRSLTDVDDEVVAIVQIETLPALRDVQSIAACSGADVLFVGPYDLTAALGIYGQLDSSVLHDALDAILAAARRSGIATGILAGNLAAAQRYVDRGFNFITVASDATLMLAGARAVTTGLMPGPQ
jgi:2-dehydro-3-deoxyglucarate aldolase/4-hydroxy-2-oxoheptanedioate aldolase